ncbi:hypothetical protein JKA74_13665 [Marivirga sp. S37H4]|uniref:Uncharacterized protein n=1 Tax=Marivirga aurantiaca TaxID=2802615 RepID=A0A934X0G0_9BACT|nr:hypothetical protein [Marivirga aurantiaca]MBK6266086.1 hypothetical protein [Marivirga aurantiaca]
MKTKEINIPPFLHDIHGRKSNIFDLTLTYSGAIVALSSVLIIYVQSPLNVQWWKLLLLALVSADIGAGAVANFTKGTNQFYSGTHKRKSRTVFILSHFIHPAVFLFVIDGFSMFSAFLVVFVIGGTFLINSIGNKEKQAVVAAFLMVVGIGFLLIVKLTNPFLLWFFPLYMTKLFLAFAIRRYS